MQSTAPRIFDPQLSPKIYQASRNIPRHLQWRFFIISLIVSDLLTMGFAFLLSYLLRFEFGIFLFNQDITPSFTFYQSLVFVLLPIWLAIFAAMGLYNQKNLLGGPKEYAIVFNATTVGLFTVITVSFLLPDFIVARGWLLLAWILTFLMMATNRFILRRVVYSLRKRGYFLSPAVIVGANDEGISLAQQLVDWKTSGFHVVGFVDKKVPVGARVYHHLKSLGTVKQLDKVLEQYDIEEIILASSAFSSRDNLLDIFKRYGVASDINVRLSSGLYEIITTGLTVRDFAYVPLVEVNPVRLTGFDRVLKVALDYSLTIPGLILVAPILLLIAVVVKLDSPGPIIHRRRVMGVNGRQFDALKFRTMYENGDEILAAHPDLEAELAQNHKLMDDPRITRVGKFLRKISLDELPQLLNVLKGDMSLVGPRMIAPEEIREYDQWDLNLLTVRPGITGLWQVRGRSDISYEERVRYDMQYIRNWSIWWDFQILFQTIPVVIKSQGAY